MQAAAASTAYFSGLLLVIACGSDVSLGRGDGVDRGGLGGAGGGAGVGGAAAASRNCGGESAQGGYFEAGTATWDGSAGNPYGYPPGHAPAASCAAVGFHDTCDFWELCVLACDDADDCPVVDGGAPPECRTTSERSAGTCVLPCSGEQACPTGMQCVHHPYGYGEICMWRELAPIEEADFPEALVAAVCDGLEPCCTPNGLAYDREGCAEEVLAAVQNSAPDFARSQFRYDAAAAAECVELARQQTARCRSYLGGACGRVYSGTTEPGAVCSVFNECRAPQGGAAQCELTSFEESRCVEQPRGRLGDACRYSCLAGACGGSAAAGTAGCHAEDGLYCDEGTCREQVPEGSSCGSDDACAGARVLRCAAGICRPRGALGAACSSRDECGPNLHCEATLGTCQPRKATGEVCDELIQDECIGYCQRSTCVTDWPYDRLCGGA